jgi:hypothetical protein
MVPLCSVQLAQLCEMALGLYVASSSSLFSIFKGRDFFFPNTILFFEEFYFNAILQSSGIDKVLF